jgi:hypothetical protein
MIADKLQLPSTRRTSKENPRYYAGDFFFDLNLKNGAFSNSSFQNIFNSRRSVLATTHIK